MWISRCLSYDAVWQSQKVHFSLQYVCLHKEEFCLLICTLLKWNWAKRILHVCTGFEKNKIDFDFDLVSIVTKTKTLLWFIWCRVTLLWYQHFGMHGLNLVWVLFFSTWAAQRCLILGVCRSARMLSRHSKPWVSFFFFSFFFFSLFFIVLLFFFNF
jgi:hypothetical protein